MLFGKTIFDAKGKILLRNPGKKTILQLNETSKYLFSLILRNRKHYGYICFPIQTKLIYGWQDLQVSCRYYDGMLCLLTTSVK